MLDDGCEISKRASSASSNAVAWNLGLGRKWIDGGACSIRRREGFTLVELMVALVVLLIIMGIVFTLISQTGALLKNTTGRVNSFQEARSAFEAMTHTLSQATLNTYYDYDSATNPTKYIRQSELHFICGSASTLITSNVTQTGQSGAVRPTHAVFFQAPLGYDTTSKIYGYDHPINPSIYLNHLLNPSGYYIEFNTDAASTPAFLSKSSIFRPRYRYRLMEVSQPSINLLVYNSLYTADKLWPKYGGWFNTLITNRQVHAVAENIVALIIQPRLSPGDSGDLAPEYSYDSRYSSASTTSIYGGGTPAATRLTHSNQLPPIVQITMVAIDETSAVRLATRNGVNAPALVSSSFFKLTSNFSSGDPTHPADLEQFERSLTSQGITYQVFSLSVSLLGAKWSND